MRVERKPSVTSKLAIAATRIPQGEHKLSTLNGHVSIEFFRQVNIRSHVGV
jgi:hypothetical protein